MKILGNSVKPGKTLDRIMPDGNGGFTSETVRVTGARRGGGVTVDTGNGRQAKVSRRELKNGAWGR